MSPPLLESAVVVLWPAAIEMRPPDAVVPAPTVMAIDPALPLVDAPVPTDTLPLVPGEAGLRNLELQLQILQSA